MSIKRDLDLHLWQDHSKRFLLVIICEEEELLLALGNRSTCFEIQESRMLLQQHLLWHLKYINKIWSSGDLLSPEQCVH